MEEIDLARELADIADEITAKHFFHANVQVTTTKKDGTFVTQADREVEGALRERIKEHFPEHGILGEENGLEGPRDGPVWIIDPIDGTNNFAWGIPIFATLIALRVGGRTEIGLVSAPALNERYEAARGDGATLNGEPIHVSAVGKIEDAMICSGSMSHFLKEGFGDRWLDLLQRARRDRGFGDFWGHMLVARGSADVMAEPKLAIWDVAALEVIVEEAGGRLTGFSGKPYTDSRVWGPEGDGSVLTTNGLLHDDVLNALSDR